MYRLLLILMLTYLTLASATAYGAVTINELYPAPESDKPEWVELYNDSSESTDSAFFSLSDLTGKKIPFTFSLLLPRSYGIATAAGVLNNNGDTVFLKNNQGTTLETVTYAENFDQFLSWAKCPDGHGDWQSVKLITQGKTNESACRPQEEPTEFLLEPTTNNQQPISNNQLPKTNFQQPISNHQLPTLIATLPRVTQPIIFKNISKPKKPTITTDEVSKKNTATQVKFTAPPDNPEKTPALWFIAASICISASSMMYSVYKLVRKINISATDD